MKLTIKNIVLMVGVPVGLITGILLAIFFTKLFVVFGAAVALCLLLVIFYMIGDTLVFLYGDKE